MNIIELIERKSLELCDGECWTIRNVPSGNGYHYIHGRGLHRIAWEAHNAEPIPPGMRILHSCDNPACFNPEHLSLGTASDNAKDMVAKQRNSPFNKPRVPVTRDDVYDLKDECFTLSEIALICGCNERTIRRRYK